MDESDGREGFIRVWNAELTQVEAELCPARGKHTNYTVATCAPNGEFYVLAEIEATNDIQLVDAASGNVLDQLPQTRDQVRAVAVSSDNQLLAVGYRDGSVVVWNLENHPSGGLTASAKKRVLQAHDGELKSLKFADKRRLVTCGSDGYVKSWTLPELANPISFDSEIGSHPTVSSDGQKIAYLSAGSIHCLNADTGQLSVFGSSLVSHVKFSPDSRFIAAVSSDRLVLMIIDATTGVIVHSLSFDKMVRDFSYSMFGQHFAVIGSTGDVSIWNVDDWRLLGKHSLFRKQEYRDYRCAFADDRFLVCVGKEDVLLVDIESPESVISAPIMHHLHGLCFSSQIPVMATAHSDGAIRLWNWRKLSITETLTGHGGPVTAVEFVDGDRFVSTSKDGTIRVWSAMHRREFGVLDRRQLPMVSIDVPIDGSFLSVAHVVRNGDYARSLYRINFRAESVD